VLKHGAMLGSGQPNLGLVSLLLVVLGCGSDDAPQGVEDAELGEPTFEAVSALLQQNCARTGCHATPPRYSLVADADLYDRLTTPLTKPECDGFTLVIPGNPEQSLLPRIVGENPPCAARMPFGCEVSGTCLSGSQIQLIEDWIDAGAPRE